MIRTIINTTLTPEEQFELDRIVDNLDIDTCDRESLEQLAKQAGISVSPGKSSTEESEE